MMQQPERVADLTYNGRTFRGVDLEASADRQ